MWRNILKILERIVSVVAGLGALTLLSLNPIFPIGWVVFPALLGQKNFELLLLIIGAGIAVFLAAYILFWAVVFICLIILFILFGEEGLRNGRFAGISKRNTCSNSHA